MEITKWVIFTLAERKRGVGQVCSGLSKMAKAGLARGETK